MGKTKLRKAREDHGYTQRDIAEKAGIAILSYQRYENGKRRPDIDTAFAICDIFGTSVEEMFKNGGI